MSSGGVNELVQMGRGAMDMWLASKFSGGVCTEPPDSYEREGANTVMGVGVSNGAANILDQFDRFNCHVICGRDWKSNGDAERDGHKYTAGWFGTNDLMERDDTAAEVAKYADSLEWLDLKDADSLASFGYKCQSEAFPAGTYRWGWVIWAPSSQGKGVLAAQALASSSQPLDAVLQSYF